MRENKNHDDEKKRLEKSALKYFLLSYDRISGKINCGEGPDFIIIDKKTGLKYGIEITHLYDGKKEAMQIFGKEWKYEGTTEDLVTIHLNKLLKDKEEKRKHYRPTDKILLVIRIAGEDIEKEDIIRLFHKIKIPENKFDEIWLVIYNQKTNEWSDSLALKRE